VKLATLIIGGEPTLAVVSAEGEFFWTVEELSGRRFASMTALIAEFASVKGALAPTGGGRVLAGVRICAPLKPARNVMCVGKNYHAHAREFTGSGFDSSAKNIDEAIPDAPIFFTKPPETVIGPGQHIQYPTGYSEQIDYEAELGVVIAKPGKRIPKDKALEYVFGYLNINDVTARDLQAKHKQWFIGKSLDTFCPMGPWLVTADEIANPNLSIKCWVNGELRQSANTRDLIFDVPTLIATLSAGLTLQAGDVIATGTPAGVGIGFKPPKFLSPGDEVEIEIEGLGRLVNRLM
jgi:2-keto-4-pentenoate hydratase/2-oxohepta-3-ene-1,7-dioic acid hydratase in catechol pathway